MLTPALYNPPQSPFIKGEEKGSSPFSKGESEPALVRLGWHISQPIKVALFDQSTSHFIKPGLGQGGFVVDVGSIEVLVWDYFTLRIQMMDDRNDTISFGYI